MKRYLKSDDISDLLVDTDSEEIDNVYIKRSSEKYVPKLCETRWSARVVTLSSIISKYKAILLALYDIMLKALIVMLELMPKLMPNLWNQRHL